MVKNKKNKNQRVKEAKKAQLSVNREGYSRLMKSSTSATSGILDDTSKGEFNMGTTAVFLPIKEIKKDLVRNGVFAVFTIVVLVVLKITNFGFDQIAGLVRL